MGTGMRDEIKKRPFSLKITRKTKYNNGYKQIKNRIFICLSEIYDLFGP
ncbi:hypothetical protein M067_0038 [Bacteroides fragilis str. J-143-4]|nr:hypothetical protein M067_0038 [Bacteroides fragilis str. J-143-4]